MQLKVGILFNSPSETTQNHLDILSEKGVLDEVDAVRGALEELKFEYVLLPIKNGITSALEAIKINKPQVIFNLAEGIDGDSHMEMHIPALLELINVPYTGSSGLTLGLCLNKASAKAVLESAGIKTPRYKVAYSGDFDPAGLRFPLIIKPVSEDASLGITGKSVVNTREKLKEQIDFVLNSYSQPALVEEFIDGREFNISVIGNNPSTVLPVSELDFSALSKNTPKVCSYNAKWVEGTSE